MRARLGRVALQLSKQVFFIVTQDKVFRTLHSDCSAISRRKRTFSSIQAAGGEGLVSVAVRTTCNDRRDRDRALASHVPAQAQGIATFVSGDPSYIVYANAYGDAFMWVSRPQLPGSDSLERHIMEGLDNAVSHRLLRRRRKGKTVHAPVLNVCETIVVQNMDNRARSASLHSPAVVMPRANYSTVLDRWRSWSVGNGSPHAGSRVDPDQVLDPSPVGSWSCISMVKEQGGESAKLGNWGW